MVCALYDVGAGKHGSEFNDRCPAPKITTCKYPQIFKVEVNALVRRIWNIFAQIFVLLSSRFWKCKSLYLNERDKCYGRKMYAFNAHKMVQNCIRSICLCGSRGP